VNFGWQQLRNWLCVPIVRVLFALQGLIQSLQNIHDVGWLQVKGTATTSSRDSILDLTSLLFSSFFNTWFFEIGLFLRTVCIQKEVNSCRPTQLFGDVVNKKTWVNRSLSSVQLFWASYGFLDFLLYGSAKKSTDVNVASSFYLRIALMVNSVRIKDYNNKSSAAAEMGDRLATIDMDRKVGAAIPFPWGSWVPI